MTNYVPAIPHIIEKCETDMLKYILMYHNLIFIFIWFIFSDVSILVIRCPSQAGALLQRKYLAPSIDEMIPVSSAGNRVDLIVWRTLILMFPVFYHIFGSWLLICKYVNSHSTRLVQCCVSNRSSKIQWHKNCQMFKTAEVQVQTYFLCS